MSTDGTISCSHVGMEAVTDWPIPLQYWVGLQVHISCISLSKKSSSYLLGERLLKSSSSRKYFVCISIILTHRHHHWCLCWCKCAWRDQILYLFHRESINIFPFELILANIDNYVLIIIYTHILVPYPRSKFTSQGFFLSIDDLLYFNLMNVYLFIYFNLI